MPFSHGKVMFSISEIDPGRDINEHHANDIANADADENQSDQCEIKHCGLREKEGGRSRP